MGGLISRLNYKIKNVRICFSDVQLTTPQGQMLCTSKIFIVINYMNILIQVLSTQIIEFN